MKRHCVIAAMVLAVWTTTPSRALACTALPTNIQTDALFEPFIQVLLATSPTFGRQVERIEASPLVSVSIRPLPRGEESCCRARTTIRRYSSGAIIAWVEIPTPRTKAEYAELFGHEFEHILEQIDLVDLGAQADGHGDALRTGDGAYETKRARRVGLTVATEASRKEASGQIRCPGV
jgi:hypothetical protein